MKPSPALLFKRCKLDTSLETGSCALPLLAPRDIRALRPRREAVDPWRAHGVLVEDERQPGGSRAQVLTVFLAGAECPYTCVFCDLWRYTTETPTPAGAIPAQLVRALDEHTLALDASADCHLKLYNASNFFDKRAVPPIDAPVLNFTAVAETVSRFVWMEARDIGLRGGF